MEESAHVDATLSIFRRLRESGRANVGTVLQSYLYRSAGDLEELLDLEPNLRLVKGAYLEPPTLRIRTRKTSTRPMRASSCACCARRRELHRDRDARRAPDRAGDQVRRARGDTARAAPVPASLRRAVAAAARPPRARTRGVDRDAVRAGLVPLPDAPPGRAAREPHVLRAKPRAPLTARATGLCAGLCASGRVVSRSRPVSDTGRGVRDTAADTFKPKSWRPSWSSGPCPVSKTGRVPEPHAGGEYGLLAPSPRHRTLRRPPARGRSGHGSSGDSRGVRCRTR